MVLHTGQALPTTIPTLEPPPVYYRDGRYYPSCNPSSLPSFPSPSLDHPPWGRAWPGSAPPWSHGRPGLWPSAPSASHRTRLQAVIQHETKSSRDQPLSASHRTRLGDKIQTQRGKPRVVGSGLSPERSESQWVRTTESRGRNELRSGSTQGLRERQPVCVRRRVVVAWTVRLWQPHSTAGFACVGICAWKGGRRVQ